MTSNQTILPSPLGWKKALALFCVALFIRAPFFFRDYVDHDESTFILMGQSIVDGHLPYTHLWDLKPPLLFYVFGAIEWLFPKSFIAIRFCAVLIVFASALLLTAIARRNGVRNGFFVALFYIMLSSEFGPLQGFMSEHLAVFFLLLGFALFQKRQVYVGLAAGIFMGCALMTKLSYAYAIAAFVMVYVVLHRKRLFSSIGLRLVLFGLGIAASFFLVALPYIIQHKTTLFIDSTFLAPLQYSQDTQKTVLQKMADTWWVIIPSLVLSYFAMRRINSQNREAIPLTIALLLGTVYVFFSSGAVNGHYLIQAYPFIILLGAILVRKEFRIRMAAVALLVLITSAESWSECYRLFNSYRQTGSLYYRPGFQIVNELKQRRLDTARIFFVNYHIGYWLLNQYPLTKSTTHPSNLSRAYLFRYFGESNTNTSLQELKHILEVVRPTVIVSNNPGLPFYPAEAPENAYFRQTVEKEFIPVMENRQARVFIWQRNPGGGPIVNSDSTSRQ